MTTKIQKWGNSYAIRLPKMLVSDLDLKTGSKVFLVQKGSIFEVRPETKTKKKKYNLAKLVTGITPRNKHEVFDWGEPMGKEIW